MGRMHAACAWALVAVSLLCLGFAAAQDAPPPPAPITSVELRSFHVGSMLGSRSVRFRSDLGADRSVDGKPPPQSFKGTIEAKQWERVVRFLERSGFEELQDEYATSPVDHAVYTVVTLTRGSETRSVQCKADDGPDEFWVIEMVLRGLSDTVDWQRTYPGGAR